MVPFWKEALEMVLDVEPGGWGSVFAGARAYVLQKKTCRRSRTCL
jgi:hypothetical protein